jgi:ferredoxin
MKSLYPYCIALLLCVAACKKEAIPQKEEKQEFVQFFGAVINDTNINILNTQSKDQSKLHGQWTGVGMANGREIPMYTISVVLPKDTPQDLFDPKLSVQIFDIHPGLFLLNGANSYYEDFASHIVLLKRYGSNNGDFKAYVAHPSKKPFEVEITRYQYPEGSIVPYVGGKLNGVLYNEKNLQDSIVIKSGKFEVRF